MYRKEGAAVVVGNVVSWELVDLEIGLEELEMERLGWWVLWMMGLLLILDLERQWIWWRLALRPEDSDWYPVISSNFKLLTTYRISSEFEKSVTRSRDLNHHHYIPSSSHSGMSLTRLTLHCQTPTNLNTGNTNFRWEWWRWGLGLGQDEKVSWAVIWTWDILHTIHSSPTHGHLSKRQVICWKCQVIYDGHEGSGVRW